MCWYQTTKNLLKPKSDEVSAPGEMTKRFANTSAYLRRAALEVGKVIVGRAWFRSLFSEM